METLLATFISYFVSLAANEHTDRIHSKRESKLKKKLSNDELITRALRSKRSLAEEVSVACVRLAQDKDKLGLSPTEKLLWNILIDPEFHANVTTWLMAGSLPEGEKVKGELFSQMSAALIKANLPTERIEFLRERFFEQLEKSLFSNDILARWRHQKSLDYLRDQVKTLRQRADEAAGIYDESKQAAALQFYCDEAFKSWDIIDLTNLPEGDVDVVTQNLLVRQLYMPLRISIEEDIAKSIDKLEEKRDRQRRIEAGYTVDEDNSDAHEKKAGIGEWLQHNHRLVILGDPGGGKTTMLRWLATAMLLRYRKDQTLDQLPDVATLPAQQWIPVLIRCRDLGEADLCRCFSEFLNQHFLKSTLPPDQAKIMQSLILEKIASNQVLLMVDGLDEITNPQVRVSFCQEIERTAARYPNTPIIVTSRIVGYRDMPYRLGTNFKHGVISELDREHKDLFAKRWIEVTDHRQPPDERAKREHELISSLHASDRIERLTGNPMLLTTLALVKRKVGKLPSRRNKLYAEAVAVLLNWNPRFYETIEESEAIPQLEYIAFEMCRRGVQRLTDDEVMDLLEQFRREYPSVRAVRNHSERQFLALLEARSSILIKSGSVWEKNGNKEQAAWEFRHLTFQEYLAAQALLDGRYPNRNKTLPLSMQVAPLAGIVRKKTSLFASHLVSSEVPESWREALRLLVADCKDDDVDDVLCAILEPASSEDQQVTRRTRAVLAGLCLADEPNTSEEVAQQVLDRLLDVVIDEDGYGQYHSPLAIALTELNRSEWSTDLKNALIKKYIESDESIRNRFGSIWGYISTVDWDEKNEQQDYSKRLLQELESVESSSAVAAALSVMNAAYDGKISDRERFINPLFELLKKGGAEQSSAVWALGWLAHGGIGSASDPKVNFDEIRVQALCDILEKTPYEQVNSLHWLAFIIGRYGGAESALSVAKILESSHPKIRLAAIEALTRLKNVDVSEQLYEILSDDNIEVRSAAAAALLALGDQRGRPILLQLWREGVEPSPTRDRAILSMEEDKINRALMSSDIDGTFPLLLASEVVDEERVIECAETLDLEADEIRSRYFQLSRIYPLRLKIKSPRMTS